MQHIQCNLDHALKVSKGHYPRVATAIVTKIVLQLLPQNRFINQQIGLLCFGIVYVIALWLYSYVRLSAYLSYATISWLIKVNKPKHLKRFHFISVLQGKGLLLF